VVLLKVDFYLTGLSLQPLFSMFVIGGSLEASLVTLSKMPPNKKPAAAKANAIKKEGKADYFAVEEAALTSWECKTSRSLCAGAKEGSDGEVSLSLHLAA